MSQCLENVLGGGKPQYPSYLDTIGKTPLVKLGRMLPDAAQQAKVLPSVRVRLRKTPNVFSSEPSSY